MKRNLEPGNRGINITPSARPSIHSHNRSPLSGEAMGRYGITDTHKNKPLPQEGRDEIDNVMSKFCRTPSPKPVKHVFKDQQRRNSIDCNNQYTEDDNSNDDHIAKSLPTYLPSYSSEDSDTWQEVTASPNTSRVSGFSSNSDNSIAKPFNEFNTSNKSHFNNSVRNSTQNNDKSRLSVTLYTLGVVALVAAGWLSFTNEDEVASSHYDRTMFYKDIDELGEKFRIDSDSLLRIKSGIATISEKQDTASFLFLYNSKLRGFDDSHFNNFVDETATFSAKYLRNNSVPAVHHTTVEGSKLQLATYSDLIREYKDDIKRTGVVLFKELLNVPSNLAMAFHYYCDEYNPLAKKSAVFFTLDVAQCSNIPRKATHEVIEKCLASKWTSIPDDNIGALLTRIVNIIVDVSSS